MHQRRCGNIVFDIPLRVCLQLCKKILFKYFARKKILESEELAPFYSAVCSIAEMYIALKLCCQHLFNEYVFIRRCHVFWSIQYAF